MKARSIFDKLVFAAFLVMVASLSIQKPAIAAIFKTPVSATDVIFPVVLLLTFAAFAIGRRLPRWNSVYIFFAAYITAFFISSLFAPDLGSALAKTFATAYLVGLAVVTIELVDSQRRLEYAIYAWLAGATVPILIGIATLFVFYISPENPLLSYVTYHHGAVPVGNFPRLSSTFISASMFCNNLTATVMLFIAARQHGQVLNLIRSSVLVLLLVCALFTVSAGLGAFLFALALWFHYSNDQMNGWYARLAGFGIFIASLLATLVAFQPHSTAPYSYLFPVINVEVFPSSRIMVWTDALKTLASHFIFGSGPGTPSASVLYQNTTGEFSLLTDAHNSFLSVAAQTGILGLIAFVALVFRLSKVGFGRWPLSPGRYALAIAFLSAFILQGLTGSFEDARHMWVLIGMMVAAAAIETKADNGSAAKV